MHAANSNCAMQLRATSAPQATSAQGPCLLTHPGARCEAATGGRNPWSGAAASTAAIASSPPRGSGSQKTSRKTKSRWEPNRQQSVQLPTTSSEGARAPSWPPRARPPTRSSSSQVTRSRRVLTRRRVAVRRGCRVRCGRRLRGAVISESLLTAGSCPALGVARLDLRSQKPPLTRGGPPDQAWEGTRMRCVCRNGFVNAIGPL